MNTNANLPAHTIVDLSVWDRGPVFRHFIDDLRCVMSMTVDLDVSRLLNSLHKRGLSFYPAMIWMVTRVLNAHDESGTAGMIGTGWSSGSGSSPIMPISARTGKPSSSW